MSEPTMVDCTPSWESLVLDYAAKWATSGNTDAKAELVRMAKLADSVRLPQMRFCLIVIRTENGYWGKGKTIQEALRRVRQSGCRNTAVASVTALTTNSLDDLCAVEISGYGDISYPQTVKSHYLGKVSVNVNQRSMD